MSIQTRNRLSKLGVSFRKSGGCCKTQGSGVYRLPIRLNEEVISFLQPLGIPAVSFEQTSLLKIENNDFSITGIRRMSQIRLTIKKEEKREEIVDTFEEVLAKYIESNEKRS